MEARANGTEISGELSRELLNFRSAKHLTENLEIPGAKWNGKKTSGKIV